MTDWKADCCKYLTQKKSFKIFPNSSRLVTSQCPPLEHWQTKTQLGLWLFKLCWTQNLSDWISGFPSEHPPRLWSSVTAGPLLYPSAIWYSMILIFKGDDEMLQQLLAVQSCTVQFWFKTLQQTNASISSFLTFDVNLHGKLFTGAARSVRAFDSDNTATTDALQWNSEMIL